MVLEWMGVHGLLENFFLRLRNAWDAFWTHPYQQHQEQGLTAKLENAKSAVHDLYEILKQHKDVDQQTIQTILRGLEQSLELFTKVEPAVQGVEQKMLGKSQEESPERDEHGVQMELPEELHHEYVEILKERDRLIKAPETEDTVQALLSNNSKLDQFFEKVTVQNQKLPPGEPNKKKIEGWLKRIENDAAFREVQNLLEFAKRRHDDGFAVARPNDYHQAVGEWMRIAAQTSQEGEQFNHMKQWYGQLPEDHSIKQFVQQELQQPQHKGNNEEDLFLQYAKYWKDRYPHHLARS